MKNALLKSNWKHLNTFPIIRPLIPSGCVYHFTTPSGLLYEVRFGAKTDDLLAFRINFSVLGEEFESEYALTNRGEVFGIIPTVTKILSMFYEHHPRAWSFEFSGEYKDDEDETEASIRTKMYYRHALRCLDESWKVEIEGNRVVFKLR